jgi:hypothetical protein
MSTNRRAVTTVAALALVTSCLTGTSRGHALYPATDPPPKREEVARLAGYVEHVDGQEVASLGSSFELLPGCHIVQTPSEWGSFGSVGGVIVKTGHLVFALPMQAAHQYVIAIRTTYTSGPVGNAAIEATETDLEGNIIHVFSPARSAAEEDACRKWKAPSRASDPSSKPAVESIADGGASG